MNSWKEYAYLFANGKFSIKHLTGNIYQFRGWDNEHPQEPNVRLGDGSWSFLNSCTLIARPILDMTDEEIRELLSFVTKQKTKDYKFAAGSYKGDYRIFYYEKRRGNDWQWDNRVFDQEDCNKNAFLYLLSIGVYPFNQSHFETGEVININELHKESE